MATSRTGHLLAAALLALATGSGHAETLTEAVRQTLRTNPEIQIEAQRRLAAGSVERQAAGGYLPRIDVSMGAGREARTSLTTNNLTVGQKRYDRTTTLTQMLFDGFATSSEVERNRARAESASHRVAATSEQTSLKAIEVFLEVLRLQEALRLTQENLAVHLRTYDQIKLRASSGVGRKSDQDQIEARLALARANLTAAEANLDVAAINYKLVIGTMPGQLDRPNAPDAALLPRDANAAVEVAVANNRLLLSAKADVDAADAQHRAARAANSPRLDLELGRQNNDTTPETGVARDDNRYAMLRLRFTAFKGGSDMARIDETRHQIFEAQEILNRAERQLEQSVRLTWSAYRAAQDRLPNLQRHAEASLLTREAYAKQFGLGQRTLLDLLDTENEYFTASVNHINGIYVELYSRFRVLADLHLLLDALGLPQRDESSHENPRWRPSGRTRGEVVGETGAARQAEPAGDDRLMLTASGFAKPVPIDTPPPEPIDARLPPLPAAAPVSGTAAIASLYVDVGRLLPAASAHRLRNRLHKLGFSAMADFSDLKTPDQLRVSVGPFATAEAATAAIEKLDELGLRAQLRAAPKAP